jgi:alpha-methylacyl-CoA racemase
MCATPLQGIQIINLGVNLPGPAAAARLVQLGATLIKVEPPSGDPMERRLPAWYQALSAGQKIIRLDLKQADQRQELDPMLAAADLLLTSSRLASLARLGLAWRDLHPRFPQLCQVAIIGHPAPDEHRPGHDLTYQAWAGLVQPPGMPHTLLADLAGAEHAATQALAMVLLRERGFGSGYCEVSLLEAAEAFTGPIRYGLTTPGGLLGGGLPGYGLYRTQEGWLAVAVLEEQFWIKLNQELGLNPDIAGQADLQEKFLGHTAVHWETWAVERDLPLVAVREG